MTARVGVNLLWIVPGVVGGSEESTTSSLRALSELAPEGLAFELFVLEPFARTHPDVVGAFPSTVLAASGRSRAVRIAAESSWLARRSRHVDLMHHAGGTAPALRSAPYVLTVHDLQPLERDATHGRLKRGYLAAALPPSVRHARRVIVPSDFVKRSVVERLGADPAKIDVVPHGVATSVASPAAAVEQRYQLDGPLVLYPAITYPHKNHEVLVEAFARVARRHTDALLVLPGGPGAREAQIMALADRLGIASPVRRTGRVPVADLAALYRMAAVVALPSRYEGFGLPAAEAMAYGAPLVAADATALPEVVGEAGTLVDPDDVDGWAAAISALLDDPVERERLSRVGSARAQAFTWEANARALVAAYRAALT